jgi:hypothetical protein
MKPRELNVVIVAASVLLILLAGAAALFAQDGFERPTGLTASSIGTRVPTPVPTSAVAAPLHRGYHKLTIAQLATSQWTHVQVDGLVTYVRKQADGDVHVTIEDAGAIAVVEIIPAIPLPTPRKNQRIRVRGISRQDRDHGWREVHPAESIEVLSR